MERLARIRRVESTCCMGKYQARIFIFRAHRANHPLVLRIREAKRFHYVQHDDESMRIRELPYPLGKVTRDVRLESELIFTEDVVRFESYDSGTPDYRFDFLRIIIR